MKEKYNIENWLKLIEESKLTVVEKSDKISQVKVAFKNDVPVILNLDHLAALTGIKASIINKMIKSPKSFYRNFSIKKKRGGIRKIVTPHKSLLEIQQWISENIFFKFEIHDAAYGYVKKRNVALNSTQHIGCDEMLKIDLKDFFPSIKIPRVRELFNRVGYSKEVAFYLSSLCCLNGSIPQGAATSPIISNIILKTLDRRLSKLSTKFNLTYSRYADDMVFSGKSIPIVLEENVNREIEILGFDINKSKTKRYYKNCRKMVTGIVVGETEIRLPKYKRREIKQEVYFLKKYHILDQVKKYNDIFYVDRVLGRLSYWKQIEPKNEYVLNSIKEINLMYQLFIND